MGGVLLLLTAASISAAAPSGPDGSSDGGIPNLRLRSVVLLLRPMPSGGLEYKTLLTACS